MHEPPLQYLWGDILQARERFLFGSNLKNLLIKANSAILLNLQLSRSTHMHNGVFKQCSIRDFTRCETTQKHLIYIYIYTYYMSQVCGKNVTVYRKTGHNAARVNIEKRSIDFLKMYCFKPTEGNG